MDQEPTQPPHEPFRVGFVTGVTPDKWARAWRGRFAGSPLDLVPVDEAEQQRVLRERAVRMCFVRLPVDREGLHLIPLYRERPVVVVGREHPVAAYDEIDVADLADEHLLQDPDDVPEWRELATEVREGTRHPVPPMTLREAVATVAADAGVLVLPMSVARVHHRRDVRAVPVTGVAESQIGLAWPVDDDDPRVERFIGIVRGRTERSSREGAAPSAAPSPGSPSSRAPSSRAPSSRAPSSRASARRGRKRRR